MQSQRELDRLYYRLAADFLPSLNLPGITSQLVASYLVPIATRDQPQTPNHLYQRLLASAQNANMKAGVIGKSIGGVGALGRILHGFDPVTVRAEFGDDADAVLRAVIRRLKPRGKIRRTPRSIWPLYCRTILSAASFVAQFDSIADFYTWIDFFVHDERARPSLPMLLSEEIDGFGFALACDFLKELGYAQFPKPDVHLRDIFVALGLCDSPTDDYHLFKAITRVAANAGVTPYAADKIFWLIGSGYFYNDSHLGKGGRIGRRKEAFIAFAKKTLKN